MKKSCMLILAFFLSGNLLFSQENVCNNNVVRVGKATWYELASALGHCSFPSGTLPQYFGAMNTADYTGARTCGACIEVQVPGSNLPPLVIQVVDECPYPGNEQWCWDGSNHIDMNPAAFAYFAPLSQGVLEEIEWRYVPCVVTGNLTYTFKEGSSIWWSAILFRNYPLPVVSVEYRNASSSSWKSLVRMDYNYWLDDSGFGEGPYTFRITDSRGEVVEAVDIESLTTSQVEAVVEKPLPVQFPSCGGTSFLRGDADGSGTVDIVDALKTARYYVGLEVPDFNISAAEVSGDGIVNIIDALMIARYYVGLIPEL